MIYVTRLNHKPILLNCDLIECVETTPDTVISLTTGQKLMVLEEPEEIVTRVLRYRRSIHEPRHVFEPGTQPACHNSVFRGTDGEE
jgi:flagellar protein FlbD